jgi:arylsulfatase A-like enzyme
MLKRLDDGVGKIRAALARLRLADNTVILFTSDNGPVPEDYRGKDDADRRLDGFRPGETITSAAPLRGEKGTLFEGGIRVPAVVYLPGAKANTRRVTTPMSTYDIFPTALDLAGVPPPASWPLDGVSLVPVLAGGTLPERPLYWHYPHYVSSPPSEKYPDGMKQRPASAIRQGAWKLILDYESGDSSLFNIAEDPGERDDAAPENPETIARLRARLEEYLGSVNAQIPRPNPRKTTPKGSRP